MSASVEQLIDALTRADLRGHGGAGFPTAAKLRAVASQRRRPAIVVNAAEGEPLSHKDRFLLATQPQAVLDGVAAVAQALKAETVIVAVEEHRIKAIEATRAALGTRPELASRAEVVTVPPGFVTGQETALLNVLGGGPPKPTLTPPYPAEKGLRGRPTLVSNAETFAQIGRVLAGRHDGRRLVTVSGAVARPSVVRSDAGMTVAAALTAAGGVTEGIQGVLLGGYGGTWAAVPDAFGLPLDETTLRARRLTLGPGIVYALGASACPVAEVARVTRWMAGQSAGQCGPCVFGLDAIATALEDLTMLGDDRAAYGKLRRWSEMVTGRGACAHPDGVARFVSSALAVFHDSFDDHAAHGACDACRGRRVLPTPKGGGFGYGTPPRSATDRSRAKVAV